MEIEVPGRASPVKDGGEGRGWGGGEEGLEDAVF